MYGLNGEEAHFLTTAEHLKLAGLRFEKRRADWLLGRWAVKNLVKDSLPDLTFKDLDGFQIENETGGQPFLTDPDGRRMEGCLSISHREGKSFCALTRQPGARLGVDLELIEPRDPIFLDDYLGSNERDLALAYTGTERDFLVTLAWSAKEAAFKALGTGLRMDTRKVEIVGGLDNWSSTGKARRGWEEIQLAGPGLPGRARAMWQQRGDFILTLVVLGDDLPVLHEV